MAVSFVKRKWQCFRGLLFYILLFGNVSLSAQYANDRYHSSEVLAKLKVDTCYSFTTAGRKNIPEGYTVFNKNGEDLSVTDIPGESRTVYTYNENNKKLGRYFYAKTPDSDRYELIERDTHIYNDKGLLISVRTIDCLTGSGEYTRVDYSYTGDTLTNSVYYFNSEPINKTDYTYDRKKRINTETVMNTISGRSTSVFIFNTEGYLISFFELDGKGDTTISHRYRVNAGGRRTDFYSYSKDGRLSQYYHFEYDIQGLLLSDESYTEIKNGDIRKSEYRKTVFTYTFRKS